MRRGERVWKFDSSREKDDSCACRPTYYSAQYLRLIKGYYALPTDTQRIFHNSARHHHPFLSLTSVHCTIYRFHFIFPFFGFLCVSSILLLFLPFYHFYCFAPCVLICLFFICFTFIYFKLNMSMPLVFFNISNFT